MPVAVQMGGAAAAVPPAATFRKSTVSFHNVAKDARGAAVVVTVDGAEAVAILVNASIGATDGVAFGRDIKYIILSFEFFMYGLTLKLP